MKYLLPILFCTLFISSEANAQQKTLTRQDSLRGDVHGKYRTWWNVLRYDLTVDVNIDDKTISGTNTISFSVPAKTTPGLMQIDLQEPMELVKAQLAVGKTLLNIPFTREKNVFWLDLKKQAFAPGKTEKLLLTYKGKPRAAVNAPWDGGWVWRKDEKGRPWITVACQGLGASVWYPLKDSQGDEPDNGATLAITIPDTLVAVANGRMKEEPAGRAGRKTYTWEVKNPINNYTIIPTIGKYVSYSDTLSGEKGKLDIQYWVLDYNLDKARKQFGRDVKPMLRCFEHWFGAYPFYEDQYKLVESSHLGMEHQSAVAYGNKYMNGYLGRDLSGSGWGKDWDYIIVHESGHEWFANNITTRDIADMWVHEGFTTYSEVLFVECKHGKKAADEYVQGERNGIRNTSPVIGPYGVNEEGSGDMYPKGANMIHTIRQLIRDDEKFRAILRGLNKTFYHQVTSSADVETYIAKGSGLKLDKVFDQYLRNTDIPVLEYKVVNKQLNFRWTNCIAGFDMPVKIIFAGSPFWLSPTTEWQLWEEVSADSRMLDAKDAVKADPNFYVGVKKAE